MIIVPIKEGDNVERALKKLKRKFEKTGVILCGTDRICQTGRAAEIRNPKEKHPGGEPKEVSETSACIVYPEQPA